MSRRGAQGNGTIRQRPDGRWEARYTVGRDPGTGKQVQKSVYGSTQKEVRQKLNAAVKALDDGTYTEPSKMTVSQWLDIWTAEYLGGIKPASVFVYTENVRLYLKPALGATKLEALNTHTIQSFYNALSQPRGEKKALSPKTVKCVHGVLHKALKQAVAIGYLKFNPSTACTLPRPVKKEINPLDEEQTKLFLQAITDHRFQVLFTVTMFTGMRAAEVIGLAWSAVDFDRGTIRVERQLRKDRKKGGEYYFTTPKNDKPRTLAPAPLAHEVAAHPQSSTSRAAA